MSERIEVTVALVTRQTTRGAWIGEVAGGPLHDSEMAESEATAKYDAEWSACGEPTHVFHGVISFEAPTDGGEG